MWRTRRRAPRSRQRRRWQQLPGRVWRDALPPRGPWRVVAPRLERHRCCGSCRCYSWQGNALPVSRCGPHCAQTCCHEARRHIGADWPCACCCSYPSTAFECGAAALDAVATQSTPLPTAFATLDRAGTRVAATSVPIWLRLCAHRRRAETIADTRSHGVLHGLAAASPWKHCLLPPRRISAAAKRTTSPLRPSLSRPTGPTAAAEAAVLGQLPALRGLLPPLRVTCSCQ